jgi:hypothetical protein
LTRSPRLPLFRPSPSTVFGKDSSQHISFFDKAASIKRYVSPSDDSAASPVEGQLSIDNKIDKEGDGPPSVPETAIQSPWLIYRGIADYSGNLDPLCLAVRVLSSIIRRSLDATRGGHS